MSPLESSNPSTLGLRIATWLKQKTRTSKKVFVNILEILEEEMNNPLKKSLKTQTKSERK